MCYNIDPIMTINDFDLPVSALEINFKLEDLSKGQHQTLVFDDRTQKFYVFTYQKIFKDDEIFEP
jgi:hypothetical protein